MRAGISSDSTDVEALLATVKASPSMAGADLAGEVSTDETYVVPAIGTKKFTVAALDLGIKGMTPRRMSERGIEVHVLPSGATLDDVLAIKPDGVFMSNGPGDPATADSQRRAPAAAARAQDPVLRHLLRQPDLRPRARASAPTSSSTVTAASTSPCRT